MNWPQIPPFPELQTARLDLGELEESCVRKIFELRSDPKVQEFLDRPLLQSEAQARSFVQMIREGVSKGEWLYWTISGLGTKEFMGTICLWNVSRSSRQAEIGFEMLPAYWGNGYMAEAAKEVLRFGFESIGLQVVLAFTDCRNAASIRMLEGLGFIRSSAIEEDASGKNLLGFRLSVGDG